MTTSRPVSMTPNGRATTTSDRDPSIILRGIAEGEWAPEISAIRERFTSVMVQTGDKKKAKSAVSSLKIELPTVMPSGSFKSREKPVPEKLVAHSGILCADLDDLFDRLASVRERLQASPYIYALFTSPTGNGLKAWFRVSPDAEKHADSFRAVESHVMELTGETIDAACKDVGRLCFVSHDPEAYINDAALELAPLPQSLELPKQSPAIAAPVAAPSRKSITESLVGAVKWESPIYGLLTCPGIMLHNSANGERDCDVHIDGSPTIHCFHNSCAGIVSAVNRELRSRIGKAEFVPAPHVNGSTSSARAALSEITATPPPERKTGLPPIVSGAEFIAVELPKPPELIHGLLHKGSKLSLGGASKSNKTWALIDAALSVASGTPWLGCNTEQGRVLYLNMEVQAPFFQRRLVTVAKAKGITVSNQIDVWNLRGHSAPFWQLLPEIDERINAVGYSLIVLDPIYKLYGDTDENAAGDVAALMNGVESLCVRSGAAVAFGAHYSKGNQSGKESIDRISGSGVFARDPDCILSLTRHEEDDAFTLEAVLRNLPPIEPFAVRWDFPLLVRDNDLDPSKLRGIGGRPAMHEPEELLRLLPGGGFDLKTWEEKAKENGMSRSTFFRLKNTLVSRGKIIISRATGRWIDSSL